MSLLHSSAMTILERNCGVPTATHRLRSGIEYNKSKHRQLAILVSHAIVKSCDLSQRWAAGLPTEKELKQVARREVVRSFGVLTWLVWGWRIVSWIRWIRAAFEGQENDS